MAMVMVLAVTLWPRREPAGPPSPIRVIEGGSPARVESSPASPAPPTPVPAPRVPVSPATSGDALSAALHEERVSLASSMVVEGLDKDRPWVCAGEAMGLSARLGGEPEPGAVYRWVWPVAGGGAELHPGPTLQWRAPLEAGSYRVRFQVCTDLGGRRVGVLAERDVEIDVRSCGEGEGQRHEPLRLGVTQRGQGTFTFQALYQGGERVTAYAWDFGDGSTATTAEPTVEHTYPLQGLGAHDIKSFTVRLQARLDRGGPLEATAFALTRGQPPSEAPPPVDLRISRWRPNPEGGGWRSDVVVRAPEKIDITWERLERILLHWDGQADVTTRDWREVIRVEESLEHGGFRGQVTVSPAESSAEIKQILDFLYGHDATGKEVVVSWSPFKREAPPESPRAPEPPPAK
jgi:PKD domain-containing protein